MKNKISDIIGSLFIIIFGVCLVAWADKVTNILSMLIGSAFVLFGIIRIINYYKNVEISSAFELVFAIISLVIGGVLIFRAGFLKEMISFIVGIYITLASVNSFITATKISSGEKKFTKPMTISAICVLVGILCILGKFLLPDIILQFIGVMMTAYGVMSIVNTFLSFQSNEAKVINIKDVK